MTPWVKLSAIYQLKVNLKGAKPPIWRRILVGGELTLDELHLAIQVAMGWTNSHLHSYTIDGEEYGMPDPTGFMETADETEVRLDQVIPDAPAKFEYLYDFGDSWEHQVTIEKILEREPKTYYPVCTAGKGACPPEDCGGIWGYYHWLDALQDEDDEEHEDAVDFLGGDFDPKAFDLAEVNRALKKTFR